MPSHCGIASGLNFIPNNKKIFHLANDRFQSQAATPRMEDTLQERAWQRSEGLAAPAGATW